MSWMLTQALYDAFWHEPHNVSANPATVPGLLLAMYDKFARNHEGRGVTYKQRA